MNSTVPISDGQIETLKWTAENARSVFEHYSGLRVQMTVLNITAIGAFSIFDPTSSEGHRPREVFALIVFASLFGIVAYRLSKTCAIHWGLYRRCRNLLAKSLPHDLKMPGKPKTPQSVFERFFVDVPNLVFWPLLNVLAPLSAILLILFQE